MNWIVFLFGILISTPILGQPPLEPVIIDQSGEYPFPIPAVPLAFRNATVIPPAALFGQEFVPTLPRLDFVDFSVYATGIGQQNNGLIVSKIHLDSIDGPVVGRSLDVVLPLHFEGVTRFRFPSPPR